MVMKGENKRQYMRKYVRENREKMNHHSRSYTARHPEKKKETRRKQKNKRRNVLGWHSEGEWQLLKRQYADTCPSCKRGGLVLSKDHIVPLSRGGSDNIENIQPLCQSCNSRKGNRTLTRYIL